MTSVKKKIIIDEIDKKILDQLQQNGRISFRELAKRVGLSAPSVIERVRKLEDAGVIMGYGAFVDHKKVGYPIRALAYMYTSFNNPDLRILGEISAIPEVLRYWSITGENDYCIEIIARSIEDLGRILTDLAKLGKLSTCVALNWEDKRIIPINVNDLD